MHACVFKGKCVCVGGEGEGVKGGGGGGMLGAAEAKAGLQAGIPWLKDRGSTAVEAVLRRSAELARLLTIHNYYEQT